MDILPKRITTPNGYAYLVINADPYIVFGGYVDRTGRGWYCTEKNTLAEVLEYLASELDLRTLLTKNTGIWEDNSLSSLIT